MSYEDTIIDSIINNERGRKLRLHKEYLREEGRDLESLVQKHGSPKTSDNVELIHWMKVYWVGNTSYDDEDCEPKICEGLVENFDFIFNHWVVKLEKVELLRPANRLYSTQLAATERAVEYYRQRIRVIEAKITQLRGYEEGPSDDHPDAMEN